MSQQIFDNEVVAIIKSKVSSKLNKSAYVGMCILDLVKYQSTSSIMITLTLQEAGFFELLKDGAFLPASKNFYKNILLHPNHMEVSTTHLWTLTKILTLVT